MNKLIVSFFFILYFHHVQAGVNVGENQNLIFYGDMRIRAEMDLNSNKDTKDETRDDRDRSRFRLRFGFEYQQNEYLSFGGRIRSGSAASAQSPHSTMGDGFVPKTVNIDKAFIKGNYENGFYWLGKNSFPFWKQNELFWDDDVTPEGIAISHKIKLGENSELTTNGGYFILDSTGANSNFSDQAKMFAGQFALKTSLGKIPLQAAAGVFLFRENPAHIDAALADLDYSIIHLALNISLKDLFLPTKLGIDFLTNTEDYSRQVFNADQKTGFVASLKTGGLKNSGDWLFSYYYAHIEEYAVVGRFAQDDWLRWGSATVARSSNFKGHEFRIAKVIAEKSNLVFRLYLVDGIKLRKPTSSQLETGTRARLDWNIKF
jgi:Putative porin